MVEQYERLLSWIEGYLTAKISVETSDLSPLAFAIEEFRKSQSKFKEDYAAIGIDFTTPHA